MALFALALQIVLSFGHVHAYGIAAANGLAAVAAPDRAVPSAPVDKSDGAPDHYCPICALIQLAASSLASLPPTLPLPASLDPVELQIASEFVPSLSPHSLFQARAPPSI